MNIVARQLEYYNAHDLDGFMSCFAGYALIEDGRGHVIAADLDAIRERYDHRFSFNPELRSHVINRIVVGDYIIDDEHLTGYADGSEAHVVLVYTIEHDRIARVRFLA